MPSQFVQFGHISQFAHGAVGFGSVEGQPALITYGVDNQFCQLADSDFLDRTDIDVAVADFLVVRREGIFEVDVLHDEDAGICHLLAPEEFAQGGAGTP